MAKMREIRVPSPKKRGKLSLKDVKRVVKAVCPREDYEQIRLATWLTKLGIRFFAIPNGGKRSSIQEAVKFKRSGVQSGVPDLLIPLPTKLHHGLFLELKRVSGGKVSENQREWIDFLNSQGYLAKVAEGCEAAKEVVANYFGWNDRDYT